MPRRLLGEMLPTVHLRMIKHALMHFSEGAGISRSGSLSITVSFPLKLSCLPLHSSLPAIEAQNGNCYPDSTGRTQTQYSSGV